MPPSEPPLEETIGKALTRLGLTVSTAESCTGGLIGHRLTNISGSSSYVMGGIISYSNDAKERLLEVSRDTLAKFGAVSEQTAREMARGARRSLRTDIGVSVTGIAGPGGGSPNKPVGLTWVGLSAGDAELAREFVWPGDREANKADSAEAALRLLLDYLNGLEAKARAV